MKTLTKESKNELIDLEKIKRLCAEKDFSFAELGRRIGLPNREAISRRLQNSYTITGDELFAIAEQFGVTADYLRLR